MNLKRKEKEIPIYSFHEYWTGSFRPEASSGWLMHEGHWSSTSQTRLCTLYIKIVQNQNVLLDEGFRAGRIGRVFVFINNVHHAMGSL